MSYSAIRFGASTLGYRTCGMAAYMGILPTIIAKREAQLAVDTTLADVYAALYAKRYASIPMSGRDLARTDCLDVSTVTVYRSPRAARRAALMHAS